MNMLQTWLLQLLSFLAASSATFFSQPGGCRGSTRDSVEAKGPCELTGVRGHACRTCRRKGKKQAPHGLARKERKWPAGPWSSCCRERGSLACAGLSSLLLGSEIGLVNGLSWACKKVRIGLPLTLGHGPKFGPWGVGLSP